MECKNNFYGTFDEEALSPRPTDSYRTSFQVDRDRIIHSYAFRRLQAKTQVFKPGEYDFYRTRLTHTIEVSQIGRSICVFLRKKSRHLGGDFYIDPDLVEAICLAHDIGHAPFGHAGERVLNRLMANCGGFEANAQTLRLLTEIIWHGPSPGERQGMDPTRALLDGVLKYKKTRSDVKTQNHFIYDDQRKYLRFANRGLPPKYQGKLSIECQIMNHADDVAYSVGDLVDGIYARFITEQKLKDWKSDHKDDRIVEKLVDAIRTDTITKFAAHRIGDFIEACEITEIDGPSQTNRYRYKLDVLDRRKRQLKCLKKISEDLVFASPAVQQLEYKAERMLMQLFKVLCLSYIRRDSRKYRLLNRDAETMIENASSAAKRARLLCDYVSGMSDDYAVRTWRRLTDPEFGSIVDLV